MSAIALALGWWVNVVLPVVIGLNVLGAIVFLCVRRASWRFQSWVFLGLLVAFALVLVGPWYPRSAVTIERPATDGVTLAGGEREISTVSRSDSVSLSEWLPWLGGVWMLGVLVSLLRLGRSQWALRKLVKQSEFLDGGSLETYFGESVRHLLEKMRVAALRTDADVSPCCLGSVKKKVLFPAALLERLNRDERDVVLRHELFHLTSGDVLLLYFQRLMEALYWWNPVVAKLSESLSQAREGLCDEALIAGGTARQTYAELLVQLGEHSSLRMSSAVAGSPVYNGLKVRLERILRGKHSSTRLAWCGSVIAFCVCASAVLAVVQVGQAVPKPASITTTQNKLKRTDFPQLELVGITSDKSKVLFSDTSAVAVGGTIEIHSPFPTPGLSARVTFLGVIDGSIRLRWSSAKGVLEQEIELPPEIPVRLERRPNFKGPVIYDTPPVRPEDPLKEVDGDPSVAEATHRSGEGSWGVDGRGFGVVGVNIVRSDGSEKISVKEGAANSPSWPESVATQWVIPEDSVMQAWMGADGWEATPVGVPPTMLKRVDEKPTPGNGWFRLEDVSSSPNQRVARPSIERGFYDDPEFSRRHVERGLEELRQDWPGQLLIEASQR